MTPRRRRVCAGITALLAILATSRVARADAWTVADFTSPGGKPAHGIVVAASEGPGARLMIGCESGASGWRGIAVQHPVKEKSASAAAQVLVSFFGRSPVTERWQQRMEGDDATLLWPASGESLRRNLMREDATRGQAMVTVEIRDQGAEPARMIFPLDGLTAHSAELAAGCDGWGASVSSYSKRRDRRW
jgi:hypothetical protein